MGKGFGIREKHCKQFVLSRKIILQHFTELVQTSSCHTESSTIVLECNQQHVYNLSNVDKSFVNRETLMEGEMTMTMNDNEIIFIAK